MVYTMFCVSQPACLCALHTLKFSCLSQCVCVRYAMFFVSQPVCMCALRHVFCLSQCVCVSLSASVSVCCTPCSVSLSQPVRLCASGVQPGQVQHAGVSSAGLSLLSGSFGPLCFQCHFLLLFFFVSSLTSACTLSHGGHVLVSLKDRGKKKTESVEVVWLSAERDKTECGGGVVGCCVEVAWVNA